MSVLYFIYYSARVFEGHPFIVEAGVSVGGKDVKQVGDSLLILTVNIDLGINKLKIGILFLSLLFSRRCNFTWLLLEYYKLYVRLWVSVSLAINPMTTFMKLSGLQFRVWIFSDLQTEFHFFSSKVLMLSPGPLLRESSESQRNFSLFFVVFIFLLRLRGEKEGAFWW